MTAADPWPEDRRPRVIDALTDMTLALHALPVDECPFDRSLATIAQEGDWCCRTFSWIRRR
jgi:aminoglycoside phosphotransferase